MFDLKDLKDLPTPKEIEELGASLSESGHAADLESDFETENDLDDDGESEEAFGTEDSFEASENGFEDRQTPGSKTHPPQLAPAPSSETPMARDTLRKSDSDREAETITEKQAETE